MKDRPTKAEQVELNNELCSCFLPAWKAAGALFLRQQLLVLGVKLPSKNRTLGVPGGFICFPQIFYSLLSHFSSNLTTDP